MHVALLCWLSRLIVSSSQVQLLSADETDLYMIENVIIWSRSKRIQLSVVRTSG